MSQLNFNDVKTIEEARRVLETEMLDLPLVEAGKAIETLRAAAAKRIFEIAAVVSEAEATLEKAEASHNRAMELLGHRRTAQPGEPKGDRSRKPAKTTSRRGQLYAKPSRRELEDRVKAVDEFLLQKDRSEITLGDVMQVAKRANGGKACDGWVYAYLKRKQIDGKITKLRSGVYAAA